MLGIITHSSTTKAKNKLSFSSSEECISRNMILYSDPVFIITLDCTKGLESAAKLHDIVATTPAINKKICFNSSLQAVPMQDLFDLKDLKNFQFKSTILPYLISPNGNKFARHVKTEDQNVMCAFFEKMFNNLMTLNQSIISEALEKNALRWFKLIQRLLKHFTDNLCLLDDKMAKASMKLVKIPSSSSNQTENKMISQNFIRIWQFMNIGSAYLLTLYLRSANICILLAANQCSAIIINRTCLVNYKIKFNFKNSVINNDDDLKRSNTYTYLLNWTNDHYNVLKERLPQNTLRCITRSKLKNLKECDHHSTTRVLNSLKHLDLTHSDEPDQYETDTESYQLSPSHSLHGSASFVRLRSIKSSSWGPEKTASVTSIKSRRELRGCHLTQEFKDLINLCKTIYAQSKDWLTQLVEDTDINNIRGLMYELCPSPSARKLIHDSTKNINDFVQDKSLQYRKAFESPEWYQNNRIIKNLCQNVAFTLFSSSSIARAL